jgi:hypothetical protein
MKIPEFFKKDFDIVKGLDFHGILHWSGQYPIDETAFYSDKDEELEKVYNDIILILIDIIVPELTFWERV